MTKKIVTVLSFALLTLIISGCSTGYYAQNNETTNNSDDPEYNADDLNQYGEWVNVNQYGRVWYPSVVNNWQPFTNGHWSYDGTDWVWVSYEPFGWIVYHYGSWDYSPNNGWFWIPGDDQWSPARVQWINYGDNVGWAPMRANRGNWSEPWETNNIHPWMVVRIQDFNRENITGYGVPTTSRFNNGNQKQIERRQPDVRNVQRYVKEPIKVVKFEKEPVVNRAPVKINPVLRNDNPQGRNITPPVRNETPPPIRNITPPVRNEAPPVKDITPPVRNINPPVRNDVPPVKNITPPVRNDAVPVITKMPGNRNIIHMQVPPEEKQKVDRYRPKVEKDVLIKKNPHTIAPVPKKDEKDNKRKMEEKKD